MQDQARGFGDMNIFSAIARPEASAGNRRVWKAITPDDPINKSAVILQLPILICMTLLAAFILLMPCRMIYINQH